MKARIELRNALQRKADLLPAWQALAQVEEHEKNMQGLAGALRRITELAPDDLSATTKLARIYLLGQRNRSGAQARQQGRRDRSRKTRT